MDKKDGPKELADWSTAPNWSVSSITRKTEKKDDNSTDKKIKVKNVPGHSGLGSPTWSLSSILKVILFTVSPTLLKRRSTPALLSAEVWVARGSSASGRIYIVCDTDDSTDL